MSDAAPLTTEAAPPPRGVSGFLSTISFWIGALGLLGAMAADALGVAGRHLGMPLVGAIEIVQACVVVAASAAMVGATIGGGHASVHILIEHVGPRWRRRLDAAANLAGAVFFAALASGSIWVAIDLRDGHEVSDVLLLPIQPLRIFWCANAVLMTALFLQRALAAGRARR